MDRLKNFQISHSASVRETLEKIDLNGRGIIFAVGPDGRVIGVATDGDIRRSLLEGHSLDSQLGDCVNREFKWVLKGTPHEVILKMLDQSVKVIPVLDEKLGRLCDIAGRDDLPTRVEGRILARARAPVRVSFGGGGSDLTHYFVENDGAVINATVSLYCHATLRPRDDGRVTIESLDLGETLTAENIDDAIARPGKFGLFQSVLQLIRPDYGFDMLVHSDFPMGSGLGGSASVCVAILGCFNMMRRDRWDDHEIAEIAFQAERLHLGISGGWQDQYAAAFGGFNFIEFSMDQNLVQPLRIKQEVMQEMEECLILCDTGITHHSGNIHDSQRSTMKSADVLSKVKANVELTYQMRNFLLRGRLTDFGNGLNQGWQMKRQFSEMISNSHIDSIYEGAIDNGALGGKLLGAGGGGFFMFFCPPFHRPKLIEYLKSKNLTIHPFRFEQSGLVSWALRDGENLSVATVQ